jgi:hypothetical protein
MLVLAGCSGGTPTGRVASHAAAAFARIPTEARENARKLSVYFGHTSLGSQLVSGLANLGPGLSLVDLTEDDADLGSSDWHTRTDAHLAAHSQVRVVVWSWCGQQSSTSEARMGLGDLTLLLGSQATGKRMALQLLKLAVDSNRIAGTLRDRGFGWDNRDDFCEVYFGEGMSGA